LPLCIARFHPNATQVDPTTYKQKKNIAYSRRSKGKLRIANRHQGQRT
jgi:hypothetical protein